MVSWLRREWYLIKLLKWTTVKWTIWLVCGASLAKWRSGMSKLIWWYYLSVKWPIPLRAEIQTRGKWQKVREKRVNRSRLVLVLSLIGWEKGVSVNHEACYCKTKVITLVSRNAHGIQVNQSESKADPCSRHKEREKAREHVVVCFGFTSDWCRNGVSDNHEAYYCITKVITQCAR